MAAELARPGVEVIQQVRTVSPTVVTPTLNPVVVGVSKQLVSVVVPSAAGGSELNTQAAVNLGASLLAKPATGNPVAYTGLDGLSLVLSVKSGPDVEIEFVGNSLSPSSIAAQISDVFLQSGVSEMTTETYEDDAFRVLTLGVGQFETIEVRPGTDPSVLAAFGWVVGQVQSGATSYSQEDLMIPLNDFPDPNGNLDELSIEPATVRVFLSMGSGLNLRELLKNEAFLRAGFGDAPASVQGSIAAATGSLYGSGGALDAKTLTVAVDGASSPISVTFGTGAGAPANAAAVVQAMNAAAGYPLLSTATGFVITSPTKGEGSSIVVTGTAAAPLGLTGATASAEGGWGVRVKDDGNGDALSSLVQMPGVNFTAAGTAAVISGSAPINTLTLPGDLQGKTLSLSVAGEPVQTLTFSSSLTNTASVLSEINTFFPEVVPTLVSNKLTLTSSALGSDAAIRVVGGTALDKLGLTPRLVGSTVLPAGLSPDPTVLNGKTLRVVTPTTTVEVGISGLTSGSVASAIAAAINGNSTFAQVGEALIESNQLVIRGRQGGAQGSFPLEIGIDAASANDAAPYLGFTPGVRASLTRADGGGNPPLSGDELYVDGTLVGRITSVAPGGSNDTLRVNQTLTINAKYGKRWWIKARNLSASSATRPVPELVVGGDGVPYIKQDLLRDSSGTPTIGSAGIYLSYHALRLDVTAKAKKKGLLELSGITELESQLSPISTDNPLSLGLYFALLNAPGSTVSGLGIDAISADSPFGTVEAFARAAEFLEAYEVYSIAPLTNDETVAQLFVAHSSAMSAPASKGERQVIFNFKRPTKRIDKLVASGTDGNSVGSQGTMFDTGIANLSGLVQSAGLNPVGTIAADVGLYLDIGADAKRYSISAINGSVVTVRKAFTGGQNDDAYYAETDLNDSPLPSSLIQEPYAIRVRGASLINVDGTPNKMGMAETMASMASSFGNRRLISLVADRATATIGGLEQSLEGFYLCAAKAGQTGGQPPQQSLTNFPIVGFTGVQGTNDFFSEKQMNRIAAGGNDIIVQDTQGAPLISRMALTTDMSGIEQRTDSICRVLDFTAKFMRRSLKTYIGRFNITQGLIDSLSNVIQGLLGFLQEISVLNGGSLNDIRQDEDAPDTVAVVLLVDPPYPCNYIRITIEV